MSFLSRLIVRLRGLVRRDVVAGEIHDELAFHLEMRIEEYERQGMSSDAARKKALERVGNVAVHQDRGYDVRGGGVFETIIQDVRYTLRLLKKQPGFSAIAITTLALSIGVSTALFSVIDAALLHPLPFPHPELMVTSLVAEPSPRGGRVSRTGPSIDDTRSWRALPEIAATAVVRDNSTKTVVDPGTGPERVIVNEITEGYLDACGVRPILGRDFVAADVAAGSSSAVMIGYGYWLSHFNADPNVLGRSIRFTEARSWAGPAGVTTVVGVLPKGFYPRVSIWRAQSFDAKAGTSRRGMGTDTIVRLRAGATLDQAARALTSVTRASGPSGTGATVELRSLFKETTSGFGPTVNILSAAVGLILVIGCVNVAGLLLARGATRWPEFAIRASIGAGRGRLIRQLLTESVVLAVIGGSFGVLLAWMFLDGLVALVPLTFPSTSSVSINATVLASSFGLSLVTSLAFGLVPAFKMSRASVQQSIGGRHGAALSGRAGHLLVAVEVALAVVLAAGAGLLLKSLVKATSVDLGFDPAAIIAIEATPISQQPAVLTQYYRDLRERLRALPGVAEVSAVDALPMGGASNTTFFRVEGRADDDSATLRTAMPGYTTALGQTIVQGRLPSEAEISSGPMLFMINETAAREWFPTASPIGRTITMFSKETGTIIAVVRDIRQDGPLYPPDPELIVFSNKPITQAMQLIVRPVPGSRVPGDSMRQAALGVGPAVFVERIRAGGELVSDKIIKPRRRALLFGLLGGLGFMLTLVGIFGVTAYAVARRTQEIGLRLAFGARPGQVVAAIVGGAASAVLVGTAVGIVAAYFSTRVIAKFLFQTTPTDLGTFAIVAVVLVLAACAAAWIPASRAARVDPVKALREGA